LSIAARLAESSAVINAGISPTWNNPDVGGNGQRFLVKASQINIATDPFTVTVLQVMSLH